MASKIQKLSLQPHDDFVKNIVNNMPIIVAIINALTVGSCGYFIV